MRISYMLMGVGVAILVALVIFSAYLKNENDKLACIAAHQLDSGYVCDKYGK